MILFILAGVYFHQVAIDPSIVETTGNIIIDIIILAIGITAIANVAFTISIICYIVAAFFVLAIVLLIIPMLK